MALHMAELDFLVNSPSLVASDLLDSLTSRFTPFGFILVSILRVILCAILNWKFTANVAITALQTAKKFYFKLF